MAHHANNVCCSLALKKAYRKWQAVVYIRCTAYSIVASTTYLLQENLSDGTRINEKKLKNEEMANDSELSAVWPIWPVGLNNMHKMPLNFPKIPLPTYTPWDFSRRNRLQDNNINVKQASEEQTIQSDTVAKPNDRNRVRITSKHIPALTAYNSSTSGLRDSKLLKFTNPETKNLKEMRLLRVGLVPVKDLAGVDIKLPMIGQEKANMQSHDQPGVRKYCATGMLGVRFKTDAHKR